MITLTVDIYKQRSDASFKHTSFAMFQYTTPRRVLKLEHKKSVKDAERSASDKLTFRKTARTFSSYGKIVTPKQMRESRSMTVSEPSYHLMKKRFPPCKVQYFKNSATGYQKSGYSKFFGKDSLAFCERNLSQQCRVSNTSAIRATSKICVIGSPNVGKTSLIQRLINSGDISEIKRYEDLEVSKNVIVQLDDEKVNLEFQETDMRMQRYIPRDCDAYILVYSFADRRSLSNVAQLIRQLRNKYRVNSPVFLIANKLDLGNLYIPREDGKILARLHNCKYIEISLLCQPNIDMLLLGIAKQVLFKVDTCIDAEKAEKICYEQLIPRSISKSKKPIFGLFSKFFKRKNTRALKKESFKNMIKM